MAARGNLIILTADPKGTFLEGTVQGTPKPGTSMEMVPTTGAFYAGGRHQYRANTSGTDGKRNLVAILLEDGLQGKLSTDAYVDSSRCFLYCPIAGEELNILVADIAGTADIHTVGDKLMYQSGTGKYIAATGTVHEAFSLLQTTAAFTADTLCPATYQG